MIDENSVVLQKSIYKFIIEMAFKILIFLYLATASYVTNAADCDVNTKPLELYTVCSGTGPDCPNKLKLCNGVTELKSIDCGDGLVCPAAGTACVADSPLCNAVPPKFVCTSRGTFPDPKNCRRYIECSKAGDTGDLIGVINCKDTEVYSEATSACKTSSNAAECITVDCAKTMGNGFFSPYGTSTKNYALCTVAADLTTTISMYQCADGATFDKTTAVSACVFKCAAASNYAYSLNKNYYYECTKKSDGKITATLKKCSGALIFDSVKKICRPLLASEKV